MKKALIFFIVLSIGFLACSEEKKKKLFPFGGGSAPADTVSDQEGNTGFNYNTIKDVKFDLTINDEADNAVTQAIITIKKADGTVITTSVTDMNGLAAFMSSISKLDTIVKVVINHADYLEKIVDIDNIQDLSVVCRIIHLTKKEVVKPPVDTDNDGVPDSQDEFPNDPNFIASVKGDYTIAYEDLYPVKGDADFNDLVVRLQIEEFIHPENFINKIVIKAKVLATGAGYSNTFHITVLGKDYALITNPKGDTNGSWNDQPGEAFVNAPWHTITIDMIDNPVARTDVAAMPYDPYIKCNGVEVNQVHLPFVKTAFTGTRLDVDKFPWAILVPNDWKWPYESTDMRQAYPQFQSWYESEGAQNADWYLHPDLSKVYPAPSGTALSTFLLKVNNHLNIVIMGGLVAGLLIIVVGINLWRRRMHAKIS